MSTIITYSCPVCEQEQEVEVTFAQEAKTYGRPEDCYPGTSARICSTNCEHCDAPFDVGTLVELAGEQEMDEQTRRDEERLEECE